VQLRGRLTDELGRPIGGVDLVVEESQDSENYIKISEFWSCDRPDRLNEEQVPLTKQDGTYCLRLAAGSDGSGNVATSPKFRVSFRGSSQHSASSVSSEPPSREGSIRINWGQTPRVVWLGEPVAIGVGIEGDPPSPAAQPNQPDPNRVEFRVELESSQGKRELLSGGVQIGKPVSLRLTGTEWADVGEAKLVATAVRGSATIKDVFPIYRKAVVELDVHAQKDQLAHGESVVVLVHVHSLGATRPLGIILLRRPDASPLYGALVDGRVMLESSSLSEIAEGEQVLDVEYVPQDGRWLGSGSKSLRYFVLPPTDWSRYLWGALGVLVVAWLKWRSSSLAAPLAAARPTLHSVLSSLRRRRPPVRVAGGAGKSEGRVIDAHEGIGVVGATIRQERPGFQSIQILGQTQSDEVGNFLVPASAYHTFQDSRLVVEAPGYVSQLVLLGTSADELLIPLESIRRRSLRELAEWANRAGPVFSTHPYPTPKWIRDQASRNGLRDIARWAEKIEEVAFAPITPASPPVHPSTQQSPPPATPVPAFPTKDRS
jgi:hypothetical protein